MAFMMWTPGDPSNYVLDAVQIHTEMGIFEGMRPGFTRMLSTSVPTGRK